MSAPYDWPGAGALAGGCACDFCGVIYIAAPWQDGCCKVCARDSDGSGEAGETRSGSTVGDSAGLQGIAQDQPSKTPSGLGVEK